jgi:hypothetical protein
MIIEYLGNCWKRLSRSIGIRISSKEDQMRLNLEKHFSRENRLLYTSFLTGIPHTLALVFMSVTRLS